MAWPKRAPEAILVVRRVSDKRETKNLDSAAEMEVGESKQSYSPRLALVKLKNPKQREPEKMREIIVVSW